VLVLKEYQGLTFLEIAEALDVPLSTVKTRLYRGLGQLRQELVRQGIRGGAPVPAPTS
jgi:RNA polymerase sigma-70 factor (ECF subfamily)